MKKIVQFFKDILYSGKFSEINILVNFRNLVHFSKFYFRKKSSLPVIITLNPSTHRQDFEI